MALSGLQKTRLAVGGTGIAYISFTPKESLVPRKRLIGILQYDSSIGVLMDTNKILCLNEDKDVIFALDNKIIGMIK